MFGSASPALRVTGALAAGAFVIAAAGCASSSSSAPPAAPASSSAPATSAAAAPSSAAASSASSAPSSASSPRAVSTPTAGGSGGSGGAGGGAASACATSDLTVKVGTSEGAAGSVYQVLDFTNAGSAPCSLYGYPGVSLAGGSPTAQVGAAATRSAAAAAAVVTLAPGATANALLRVTQAVNYPAATCSPKATTVLHIFPPNQTAAVDVPYKSTGCGSSSVKLLTIGVIQPGANTNQ
jgi:Protein of unknown function (DUF4232)